MKSQLQNSYDTSCYSYMLYVVKCLMVFLTLIPTVFASTIHVNDDQQQLALGPYLSYFRSRISANLNSNHAWQAFANMSFEDSQSFIPNFGFTRDHIWVRLRIMSSFSASKRAYLEHRYVHTDHVELLQIRDDVLTSLHLGDRQPTSEQQIAHYFPVFPIDLAPGENEFYLRVQSDEATTLPLFLNLASKQDYQENHTPVIIGLVILLSCIGVHIAILKGSRSTGHLQISSLYLLTVFFYGTNHFFIQGFASKYFPRNDWSFWMNEGYFLTALGYQIALFFAAYYYLAWKNFPTWFHKTKTLILSFSLFVFLGVLFLPYHHMVLVYFFHAALLAVYMGLGLLYSLRAMPKLSLFYIFSWIPGIIVAIVAFMKFILDQYQHSFGFYYAGLFHFTCMTAYLYLSLFPASHKLTNLYQRTARYAKSRNIDISK
ncbi:MAG: 7TM-DISM domain-containing protein [Oligoflexus sp.]